MINWEEQKEIQILFYKILIFLDKTCNYNKPFLSLKELENFFVNTLNLHCWTILKTCDDNEYQFFINNNNYQLYTGTHLYSFYELCLLNCLWTLCNLMDNDDIIMIKNILKNE